MSFADKVLINGKIYCVQPRGRYVEAVAVKDGKFLAAGTDDEIEKYISSTTVVVDLEKRTVLPGLHDMHIHAIKGAYKQLFDCNLPEAQGATIELLLKTISEFAEKNPDTYWIRGGNWRFEFVTKLHKNLLDSIDAHRPMIFFDFSTHNAWVNSKALEIAGIDSSTPDPEGGIIVKDDQGEPTGVLLENAVNLIYSHLPEIQEKDMLEAGEWVSGYLNSFGITAIKDPAVDRDLLNTYRVLADDKKLHLRLATCLLWKCDYANHTSYEDQIALVEERNKYTHHRINVNFAKMFIDGVPAFRTAAFFEPYSGESVESHDWQKELLIDIDELKEDLIKLDKSGISVKMHATGDAAVRVALDGIEAARKENGDSGLLHEVAHNGFVDKEDMGRYKELNAVAEFSPTFWYPSEFQSQKEFVLGSKRANETYPIKSILDKGAHVVCGSDWPIVSEPNPWIAIESLVTRKSPFNDDEKTLNTQESIDLANALEFFTINAAKSVYLDKVTGSIEVGKFADMIIIDRDIFNIPLRDIRNVKVLNTLVEGEVVYTETRKGRKSISHIYQESSL